MSFFGENFAKRIKNRENFNAAVIVVPLLCFKSNTYRHGI